MNIVYKRWVIIYLKESLKRCYYSFMLTCMVILPYYGLLGRPGWIEIFILSYIIYRIDTLVQGQRNAFTYFKTEKQIKEEIFGMPDNSIDKR